MNRSPDLEHFFKRYDLQISLLMILFVAGRKWIQMMYFHFQLPAMGLLGCILLTFLLFPVFAGKYRKRVWLYLAAQICVIEVLGVLPPVDDTWSLLFIPIWAECKMVFSPRKTYLVMGAMGALMIVTLMSTFDWLIGFGYGVFMVTVGFILMTPGLVYAQYEAAHSESRRLLAEIKKANASLKKAARQAEELTAIQERIKLANELHDSVSQLMFSIKLLAQSTRIMMDKHPEAVLPQLVQLQELSSRALNQMRSLITQWRESG
jgi:signal transduction histidine kinase